MTGMASCSGSWHRFLCRDVVDSSSGASKSLNPDLESEKKRSHAFVDFTSPDFQDAEIRSPCEEKVFALRDTRNPRAGLGASCRGTSLHSLGIQPKATSYQSLVLGTPDSLHREFGHTSPGEKGSVSMCFGGGSGKRNPGEDAQGLIGAGSGNFPGIYNETLPCENAKTFEQGNEDGIWQSPFKLFRCTLPRLEETSLRSKQFPEESYNMILNCAYDCSRRTFSLASSEEDANQAYLQNLREEVTRIPDHICVGDGSFLNFGASPFLFYYHDESAPNEALMTRDLEEKSLIWDTLCLRKEPPTVYEVEGYSYPVSLPEIQAEPEETLERTVLRTESQNSCYSYRSVLLSEAEKGSGATHPSLPPLEVAQESSKPLIEMCSRPKAWVRGLRLSCGCGNQNESDWGDAVCQPSMSSVRNIPTEEGIVPPYNRRSCMCCADNSLSESVSRSTCDSVYAKVPSEERLGQSQPSVSARKSSRDSGAANYGVLHSRIQKLYFDAQQAEIPEKSHLTEDCIRSFSVSYKNYPFILYDEVPATSEEYSFVGRPRVICC